MTKLAKTLIIIGVSLEEKELMKRCNKKELKKFKSYVPPDGDNEGFNPITKKQSSR